MGAPVKMTETTSAASALLGEEAPCVRRVSWLCFVFFLLGQSKVSKSGLNSKSFEKLSWNYSYVLVLLQFSSNFKETTCHSDFNTTTVQRILPIISLSCSTITSNHISKCANMFLKLQKCAIIIKISNIKGRFYLIYLLF